MPKKLLFARRLSKTDIVYRMAIPLDGLSAFQIQEGEYSKEFQVIDINCHIWNFRCSTRRTDAYPKPVLSSGWIRYVKDKGLREGDEVRFYKVYKDGGEEDLQFEIQARKKIKLFGQDILSAPL